MAVVSITSSNVSSRSRHDASLRAHSQDEIQKLALAQSEKTAMNAAILESTNVVIGTKDDHLSLVLNTAIDKINDLLAPDLGEDAIQKAADSGLDVSPEATAGRIVSLSTAFFGAFKDQHPGEDESIVLDQFMDTIGRGIEQGFKEAREVLEGLSVLEGDIASNIDETYSLVQEKLTAFVSMITAQ